MTTAVVLGGKYEPKGGPTRVWFRVAANPAAINPGDRVILRCSLDSLGGWNTGHVLTRSDHPAIWEGEIELPIGMAEADKRGLFEFRYAIENAEGQIVVEEAGVSRRPERMYAHFYGSFKSLHDPDNGRPTVGDRVRLAPGITSKGGLSLGVVGQILQDDRDHLPYKIAGPSGGESWYKESDVVLAEPRPVPVEAAGRVDPHLTADEALTLFFNRDWDHLGRSRIGPEEFIKRCDGLIGGISGASRADAERMFNNVLDFGGGSDTLGLMALLAMMGVFGKSSDETEWVTTTGVGGYSRKVKPPAPSQWCRFVAEQADVGSMLKLKLKDELGSEGKKLAMIGIAEAVERCATTGTFDWLHIMPLLDENSVDVDVSCKDKEAFLRAVKSITDLAGEHLANAAQLFNLSVKLDGEQAKEQREVSFELEYLGLKWLRVLCHHAPDMESLHDVLLAPAIVTHIDQLEGAICSKVRKYNFPTKTEVIRLTKIVQTVEALHPMALQLSAALVSNDEIDVFTDQVLDFVGIATATLNDSVLEKTKSHESKRKTQELALLDSVKSWIKRKHFEKPAAASTTTGIWGTAWTEPTEEELHANRVKAMRQALQDVDGFAIIPSLDGHVRSLVFELSRCHFFKGPPTTILKTLCATAGQAGGFGLRSASMSQQLFEKAAETAKDIVSQVLGKPTLINNCLELIMSSLPCQSDLALQLLYTVASTMSEFEKDQDPKLSSILEREQQWATITRSYGSDSRLWEQEKPLGQLLACVHQKLSQVGEMTANESIGLRDLHTVLAASEPFMRLSKLLEIHAVSSEIIESRRAALAQFDRLLRETQCYVSFFCSCGVPIEASTLKDEVGKITAAYDTILFSDIDGAFSEVPSKAHIPWLFELQSSELFLSTFRTVGAQVCSDIIETTRLKASRYEHPEKLIAFFQAQLAAERAEAEPELAVEPAAEAAEAGQAGIANLDPLQALNDDDELIALQEELESLLNMSEPEDEEDVADRDAEIQEIRAAIEERRSMLMATTTPPRPMLRRNTELRASDIRVGTKVMALEDMGPVIQFEQGEVSAVNMKEGDNENVPREFVVQWFSSAAMTSVDAEQVNVLFTAFQMRERMSQCLRIGRDKSLSDDEKDEQMKGSLAGTLVAPVSAVPSKLSDETVAEGIVLSQQQVAEVLLPKVKQEWCNLYTSIKDQEITTAELHQRFSGLETFKRCKAEMELLVATGDGTVSTGPKPDWLPDVLKKLDDFLLSERLQRWIPAILSVRTMMSDLFQLTEDDDSSVVKVKTFYETVQQQWANQVLGTLSALVEPVKDLFQRFSAMQLDFLASLSDNEALLKWLMEHDDTDAFNSLLQVCRPRTEDPLLLKAIASLVQIRTVMLDLLYLAPPFTVFGQMLDAVHKIDMGRGTTLEHLETVQNSFEGLIELFEKETRSPGIKSCYDLDAIRNEGVFVLRACGEKELVLLLRLPKKKDLLKSDTAETAREAVSSDLLEPQAEEQVQVKQQDELEAEPKPELDSGSLQPDPPLDLPTTLLQSDEVSQDAQFRWEGAEYLEDLRSKLIMTDLPEEVEAEIPDLKDMIENFSEQLQVLSDMRDALHELHTSGHFAFQGGYQELHRFDPTNGLPALTFSHRALQDKIDEWNTIQQNARDQFYFLNYYGRRDILRLIVLLESSKAAGIAEFASVEEAREAMFASVQESMQTVPSTNEQSTASVAADSVADEDASVDEAEIAQFCSVTGKESPEEASKWLRRFGSVEAAVTQFFTLGSLPPDQSQTTEAALTESLSRQLSTVSSMDASCSRNFEPVFEFHSMLCAVATSVELDDAIGFARAWVHSRQISVAVDMTKQETAVVGEVKEAVNLHTGESELLGPSIHRTSSSSTNIDVQNILLDLSKMDPKATLEELGFQLQSLFGAAEVDPAEPEQESESIARVHTKTRWVTEPGEDVENLHDLVGVIMRSDDEERAVPIWVTCAASPNHVIDVVLSVYVRRARLPDPGEVLFCNSSTTLEDVELLIRRYLKARAHGRENALFCLADIHALSYTKQCAVVDRLQALLSRHGPSEAGKLLVVSGRRRQVILNSLSQYTLECPPLDQNALRAACTEAFSRHYGKTEAVSSVVNGAGKTHHILAWVAEQQAAGTSLLYRRIPLREATSVSSMIELLPAHASRSKFAIHVDIGHIIPASANTMLFELLLVGVIRDPVTCRVYHRRTDDVFLLEIPNSLGDKTAKALRFSSFLPMIRLEATPESIHFSHPRISISNPSRIVMEDNTKVVFVCKFLRAFRNNVFVFGSENYNLSYQPAGSLTAEQEEKITEFVNFSGVTAPEAQAWLARYGWEVMNALNVMFEGGDMPPIAAADTDITAEDCFDLLLQYTEIPENEHPNFIIFASFVNFMYDMLHPCTEWELINSAANSAFTESMFKHSFVRLLIATSKDFSTRSVAQGNQTRKMDDDTDEGASLVKTASGRMRLAQQRSSQDRDVTHAMEMGAIDGGPAPAERLTRQDSAHAAARFDSMTSWENSDHPVAVWYTGPRGVDGVDVLTLNPAFVQEYLNDNLRAQLRGHGIDIARDWSKLTNDEGIEMLRHAIGIESTMPPRLQHGYVITVDNLLKMLSISMRMKCGLPVIVMGETGCGKSSLMRSMCAILGWRLHTLNIHGGMNDADVISWVNGVLGTIAESAAVNEWGVVQTDVIFLDEVNTCNSMGLFKEMLCDGSMNGKILPPTVKIIAACNPYRLRRGGGPADMDDRGGLVFDLSDTAEVENVGTGIKDPLSELVYRVHPLPESMVDHVFDFGALSKETEKLYIKAMIRSALALYITEESMVEEASGEDQLAEQAQRMGIEFTDDISLQDKQALIRQRMREMVEAEAQRRRAAGEDAAAIAEELGQLGGNVFGGRAHGAGADGMGRKALSRFGEFVETFTELVCAAQEFVREYHAGERSSASLRDVARCIKVYRWFGEHFAAFQEAERHSGEKAKSTWSMADFFSCGHRARQHIRSAVVMSLSYCYHSRLPRDQRMLLRHAITDAWEAMQVPPRTTVFGWYIPGKEFCTWLCLGASDIADVIETVQKSFVAKMKFPNGIALNEALCENVFMILVSVLNQIPIFVIGKPGTSKSLAMELVQTNLQGKASANDFLRALPSVQTFSYQCSPLSTSTGIEQAFESARRYKMEAPNTVVVVLLDEVGLAEQSPHLPLKVLHKVLDEAGKNESVVGISNWSLDPAKMNRAVHLYRPAPTVEDLALTAEGMVENVTVKGYLQAVAKAFNAVYTSQQLADFWGMREFYATVRFINRAATDNAGKLDARAVMNAVLRNYGGRPAEISNVLSTFFENLSMTKEDIAQDSVIDLIRQNIVSPEARHLMVLTKNSAALGLLLDNGVLNHEKTQVLFGSDFPLDKTDLQVCLNIQKVKYCMATGTTLVLVHCETLYESMYDLLNQHYTSVGAQLWVRLAFGTHSRLCPIDPSFRVIVVVEKHDAYTQLAPPLLNRFEKQVLERPDMMDSAHHMLAGRLQAFVNSFASSESGKSSVSRYKIAFCGYHTDLIPSLSLSIVNEVLTGCNWYGEHIVGQPIDWDRVYQEAITRLLWIATPEVACTLMQNHLKQRKVLEDHQVDAVDVYFSQQSHSNLPSFVENMREVRCEGKPRLMQLMTYSPLFLGAASILQAQGTWDQVSLCVLHDLSSERDLQDHVDRFFETAQHGSLLLVQCDPRAASLRRVEHARYICEKSLSNFRRVKGDSFFTADPKEPAVHATHSEEPGPEKLSEPAIMDKNGAVTQAKDGVHQKEQGATDATDPAIPAKAKGIDIIILMHLPRGHDMNYSVDFDNRWTYAFIDSAIPASTTGLLNVEEMMGSTMTEMVNRIDLAKVLGNNFRYAMARLVYLYQRSNEDVRGQIAMTLECLEDSSFIRIIQERILSMIEDYKLEIDLSQITDQKGGVALVGTFQEALHRQFTDALAAMFAVVLSHMDRNFGLRLYKIAECRRLWIYLFGKSFREVDNKDGLNVQERRRFKMGQTQIILEVPSDGKDKKPFASKFPYSFYLSSTLQKLRLTVETVASAAAKDAGDSSASLTSTALQRQFEMLAFEQDLSGPLSKSMIARYAYDFTCMHLMNSAALPKQVQCQIMFRVLELYDSATPVQTLSAIHGRYWDCETRLNLYCQLLDAVPAAVEPVKQLLVRSSIETCKTQTGVSHPTACVDIAVLGLVMNMVEPPNLSQQWNSTEDYGRWCTQYDLAKPAVLSLVDEVKRCIASTDPAVVDVILHWEKLRLVDQLIRDIALPLEIEPATSLKSIAELLQKNIRTQAVFRVLVQLLCKQLAGEIDKQIAEQLAQGHTGSSTQVRSDVAATDREKMLRRGTAAFMEVYFFETVFSSQAWPMESELATDFITMLAKLDLDGVQGASSRYDLLLPSEAGRVALLTSLFNIEAAPMKQQIEAKIHEVLKSTAKTDGFLDTAIAQTYLTVLENHAAPAIEASLLDASAEEGDKIVQAIDLKVFTDSAAEPWVVLGQVAAVRRLLLIYADAITKCIEPAHTVVVDEQDIKTMQWLKSKVDPILSASSGLGGCLRSVRMYLLKTLERSRGISFVRSVMQQHPLHDASWLHEWIELNDLGLVRFMGSNKLPQNNPFAHEMLYDEVSRAATEYLSTGSFTALSALIAEKNGQARLKTALGVVFFQEFGLLNVLPDAMSGDVGPRVIDFRAWVREDSVFAFCSDVEKRMLSFCAGDFQIDDSAAGRFLSLDLSSSPEKIVTVRFLAHLAARVIGAEPGDQLQWFREIFSNLDDFIQSEQNSKGDYWPTMPDDALFMVQKALMEAGGERGAKRWFTCPNGHPFAIGNCGGAMEKARCPECNEEIGGTDHNLISGNKAMGDTTGGDHTALFQSTVLEDNSDPGYCLRTAETEIDRFFAARDLGPQALRLVRILMHGTLVLGSVLLAETWQTSVVGIVNKGYLTTEFGDDPGSFFLGHLLHDWSFVKELMDVSDDQVALLLHEALLRTDLPTQQVRTLLPSHTPQMMDDSDQQGPPQPQNLLMHAEHREELARLRLHEQELLAVLEADPDDEAAHADIEENQAAQQRLQAMGLEAQTRSSDVERAPGRLKTPEDRRKWEEMFDKNVLADLVAGEGKAQRLRDIESKYASADDEGALFKDELLERFDVSSFAVAERRRSLPGLWLYKRPFSFERFVASFQRDQAHAENYPLLSTFFERQETLLAVRHMPQVFRWLELLMERYDKRIDHASARKLPIEEVLQSVPAGPQRADWSAAFASFQAAWESSWHRIEQFGCEPIPELLRQQEMGPHVPIAFSLPGQKDEAICSFLLCQYLKEQHNDFVQAVDQAMLMQNQLVQRHSTRTNEVESGSMAQVHTLDFDMEGGFIPYVEKQCVRYTDLGETMYDFADAEKFLVDRYFRNKPLINLRLRGFKYADEAKEYRASLGAKVAQTSLPHDVLKRIKEQLGNAAAASAVLHQLETCINFLSATLGAASSADARTAVGERRLEQYLRSDLLMSDSELEGLGSVILQTICLKHLDALCSLMQVLSNSDPLEQISVQYCADVNTVPRTSKGHDIPTPIMGADEWASTFGGYMESMAQAVSKIDMPIILRNFRKFMVQHGTEEDISNMATIKDTLGWQLDDDSRGFVNEYDWFQHFPDAIPMSCALECYRLLERLH